jgi:predicted aspartyl protease
MPIYDAAHFDPPAPAALVVLRNPHSAEMGLDVALLVDTGADVTLLPRIAIEHLGTPLLADQQYELVGFDGTKSVAPAVVMEMVFLKRTFRGRFLLIDDELGILGRDVLRHVTLVLDGPRQEWWEHSP